MSGNWNNPELVKNYSKLTQNPSINWYEEVVNLPDLLSMIPKDVAAILDFGCGPGDVTVRLRDYCSTVKGTDISTGLIDIARNTHPDIEFFEWSKRDRHALHDLIFTKLTLQFVDDLEVLAAEFRSVLSEGGYVVLSVPHPSRTATKINAGYHDQRPYDVEIGDSGINTTMVHRSMQGYLRPFLTSGFVLDMISEPKISKDLLDEHQKTEEYNKLPLRLNVRLVKQ